jgi:hypothetical protein
MPSASASSKGKRGAEFPAGARVRLCAHLISASRRVLLL